MSSVFINSDLPQTVTLEPNYENIINIPGQKSMTYPTIVYTSCRYIENVPDVPPYSNRLIIGATWLEWSYLDLFDVRQALFEKSLWPYTMPEYSKWTTHKGILLRSRLNLVTLTDMLNPRIVYLTENNVIFAKMIFNKNTINFIEKIHVK